MTAGLVVAGVFVAWLLVIVLVLAVLHGGRVGNRRSRGQR